MYSAVTVGNTAVAGSKNTVIFSVIVDHVLITYDWH